MVNKFLESVCAVVAALVHRAEAGLAVFFRRLRYLPCSLRGHDESLQFQKNRLYLRCLCVRLRNTRLGAGQEDAALSRFD